MSDLRAMLRASGERLGAVLARFDALALPQAQLDALWDFTAHVRIVRGLSQNTAALYAIHLAEFFSYLRKEGHALDDVGPLVSEEWQKSLYVEKHLAGQSRSLRLTAVRQFFAWREQMTGAMNPLRAVRGPKRDKRVPRRYSTDELKAIFASCDRSTVTGKRDFALLVFLYATGARREEVTALELDQLELRERVGRVRFHGKGAKERVVPFEGVAVEALKDWLLERDKLLVLDRDAVWLTLGKAGPPGRQMDMRGIEQILRRACERAKLRGSRGMHKMRAAFATDLYDAENDIEQVRIVMGHEQTDTTRKYIAISERALKTRMPADRLSELTGVRKHGTPLWLQHKLKPVDR